jgi:O-antigen ligase
VARLDLYCVLGGLTLYGLTVTAFSTATRRIAVIVALLAFAVVHVLVSVVQFGLGKNFDLLFSALADVAHSTRGSGIFVDPDHLAGLLELLGILGLSITAWSRWPNWSRVLVGYLTAISYLGLALTGSRGGYLSAVASLCLFCLLSFLALRAGGSARLARFGGIGLAIVIVTISAVWLLIQQNPSLQTQINNIRNVDQGRLQLWQAAIEQWRLHPLVGTGSGTYLYYGREFRSPEMQMDPVDVHNDYLNLLCEYGFVGVIGFLIFFGAHVSQGLRAFAQLGPKRIAAGSSLRSDRLALTIGALCAIGAYVVHSAVDFNMHIPANALLVAFIFALLANPGLRTDNPPSFSSGAKLCTISLAVILLFQCSRLLPGEYYAEGAREALRDEDPSAAIDLAEKALTHEKQNPNIYFYLGRALVSLGNEDGRTAERPALNDRALEVFDQARRLAPLDETYPLDMARIYDRLGRFGEAEKMFALARERDPRSEAVEQLYQNHLEAQKPSDNAR